MGMLLALTLIIMIVGEGMFDQLKLILKLWEDEEKTLFSYFLMIQLYM